MIGVRDGHCGIVHFRIVQRGKSATGTIVVVSTATSTATTTRAGHPCQETRAMEHVVTDGADLWLLGLCGCVISFLHVAFASGEHDPIQSKQA
jgi:hypothetical protein